jgi:hypothetical protein
MAANYALMSDAAHNPQFRRRWVDPPKEKRRPTAKQGGTSNRNLSDSASKVDTTSATKQEALIRGWVAGWRGLRTECRQ